MSALRVLFLTGTRADYGKLKSLMRSCEDEAGIDSYIYVTGMHLLDEYGSTYRDIIDDGYKNIYIPENFRYSERMDESLAYTILTFSDYVRKNKPDVIIVHGDRIEPLAGAIVGVLNNVKVAHIEGGEITGTADEFMRHAISKLSTIHFVANEESKYRLLQLGERDRAIHVIGSPDIDVMLSNNLPDIEQVKKKQDIPFENWGILIYHPVTTATNLKSDISKVLSAVIKSEKNYIVIYPNNDHGSDIILDAFSILTSNKHIKIFDSIPFEEFLVLLKNSDFIIGNSSAGVREACVYGVPAIDIGSRQQKRYNPDVLRNIQHTVESEDRILSCIFKIDQYRYASRYFGDGQSAQLFIEQLRQLSTRRDDLQKTFVELNVTSDAIRNYINEVCF